MSAAPRAWPFCWWVVVVLDRLSRRAQGFMVIARKPDAQTCCAFLANHFSLGRDTLFIGVTLRRCCGNPVGLTRGFAIFRFSTEVGTDPTNRVREQVMAA